MKHLYSIAAVMFGLTGLNAQNITIDTTFVTPTGHSTIRFYQSDSRGSFSGIIQEFDSARRKIVNTAGPKGSSLRNEEASRIKQELDNARIAMFSNIIGFTPKEAEIFWPLYNEYLAKLDIIMADRRTIADKIRNPYTKPPALEANTLTENYINSFKKETDLMAEFYNKFRNVLDPEKLLLLYRAEYNFKIMVLRNL